jgi:cell wall-associated NlpC family hydrolase
MIPAYAVCNVYAAPLRASATHRAEQTSQLIFGECVEVLEKSDRGWSRVKCAWDNYEGWCSTSQLHPIDRSSYRKGARFLAVGPSDKLISEEAGEMPLPFGAGLWGYKSGAIATGPAQGAFKGKKAAVSNLSLTPAAVIAAAQTYRNAPYLWGGRTRAGIDCSGLIQMAFKLGGLATPRDAWQQAEAGQPVDFLQNARPADVAFFDNDEGRIVHVGLLLDSDTILHATETAGRTVVDKIDGEGIVSILLRKRTHRLRLIRRYIPEHAAASGLVL